VEHALPIKQGFRAHKQKAKNYNLELLDKIRDEVKQLLKANFIRTRWYAEWVSNIVLVEKKNTTKITVCVYFWNLKRATPKDEYAMTAADTLINKVSSNKTISFLDGNAGYNQMFMAKEDVSKTAFCCPRFEG
jgi:hypothetical protein